MSPDAINPCGVPTGLSRRDMLKRTASAFAAAAASTGIIRTVAAQVTGTTPEGGTVPFRMPMCALPDVDRKEYIHNLEIHARIRASGGVGTDGVTSPLWARGAQRLLPGLRIYDISDPTEPKEVAYFVPARTGDMAKWETWRRADVSVFVEWDRNLIWVSTSYLGNPQGEIFCMSCPALGKPVLEPRKVERWTLPHINGGWDDQTPKSVYLGRSLRQLGG